MTQQYEELLAAAKTEVTKTDAIVAKKCYRNLMILNVLSLALSAVTLIILFTGGTGYVLTLAMAYGFLGINWFYRLSFRTNMIGRMTQQCRPEGYLSLYLAIISRRMKKAKWEEVFFNVALCLIYQGDLEGAKEVAELYSKYCFTDKGRVFYTILQMQFACLENDVAHYDRQVAIMEDLMKQVKMKKRIKSACDKMFVLGRRMKMEVAGKYRELYEEYLQPIEDKSILAQVVQNYRLYRMATQLGMTQEAEKYKEIVLEKGGTTFYKKSL